jgi:hypothetical protein
MSKRNFIKMCNGLETETYSVLPPGQPDLFKAPPFPEGYDPHLSELHDQQNLVSTLWLLAEIKTLSPHFLLRRRKIFSLKGVRLTTVKSLLKEGTRLLNIPEEYCVDALEIARDSSRLERYTSSGRIIILDFQSKTRKIFTQPEQFSFFDEFERRFPSTFLPVFHVAPFFRQFFITCPTAQFWILYKRLQKHQDDLLIPFQISVIAIPDLSGVSFG